MEELRKRLEKATSRMNKAYMLKDNKGYQKALDDIEKIENEVPEGRLAYYKDKRTGRICSLID